MITPDKRIVPLDVVGDVPYIKKGELHTQLTDPRAIRAQTGVYIDAQGNVQLHTDHAPASPASQLPPAGDLSSPFANAVSLSEPGPGKDR